MSKKAASDAAKSMIVLNVDPTECPFREFRDNELQPEFWGLSPSGFRSAVLNSKAGFKPQAEHVWIDDQTQPLPRSVRQYLNGWVRAEELAMNRWEAETVVFEENNGGKMSIMDIQLSHAQVILRSSFCRKVLSACFILERTDAFVVEHQWENFSFSIPPEGWRARYHIYSPGTKPGGGLQHRPGLSKNGCYLVRLFYLGAWRCVWVNDQVPVDATDSPLLPFSPFHINAPPPATKAGAKTAVVAIAITPVVHLWPLLICKALLKLAAPDMNSDEDMDSVEDELMTEFSLLHCLTGAVRMTYKNYDYERLWKLIITEVPVFSWDDDDETQPSTVKSKSTKKSTAKETTVRSTLAMLLIRDSKALQPFILPGITPAHEMVLIMNMARDLPLKKPLPEPEVALWKHYRWIDWAKRHGLYDAYACPNTKFLKVNGLLKLSHAPHLLDVQSTESIVAGCRDEHDKTVATFKKNTPKEANRSTGNVMSPGAKEELREWIQFNAIFDLVIHCKILYFPSMYQYIAAGSNPQVRNTKLSNKPTDIVAPKCAPLYLQIDGPEDNTLKISLNMLHPRILLNSGIPLVDYIEPAYLILEKFQWFVDCDLPLAKAFVRTRGYDSVEVTFEPGRHICRLWVHSRMNWHIMLLSESTLLLGTKDIIKGAAIKECPWAVKFLSNLGTSFTNWIKMNRSTLNFKVSDREFYKSYQPDLTWDQEKIGFDKSLLHWMFRQALKAILAKRLAPLDFAGVCPVLRKYFCDPDFGLPDKPKPQRSVRDIADMDPCDCLIPEAEEIEETEEIVEEQEIEEKPVVDEVTMAQLLRAPVPPITSQVCELATEELPCGILKEEREKEIRKHEAATVLQAHWRGTWARKCLNSHVSFTPEITKLIMENAFGNMEALSALMNEFFAMYPSVKPAYSVASALTGTYSLRQFTGAAPVTPTCKWIPYFQGIFHCHQPVKVHFDLHSSLHSTIAVYDNDTGLQKPQVFNTHITFDFRPNNLGYTVMGHGTLNQPTGSNSEIQWNVTVLSSIDNAFHICDNDLEGCKEQPLAHSNKLHLDEIFIPNRRNILGGVQVSVMKNEVASFRAAAVSNELEIEVILRTMIDGQKQEIGKCSGIGEVFWPYIKLDSAPQIHESMTPIKDGHTISSRMSKSPKVKIAAIGGKKSAGKLKTLAPDQKLYYIEVVAPQGWPLSLAQWRRVDEIRNSPEYVKIDIGQHKKPVKEKPTSAKSKDKGEKEPPVVSTFQPQPDDAYVTLECSLAIGGGAYAKRDDDRDLELATAIRSWDLKEPGRNQRGAQIRKEFRAEFLEAVPVPPSESEQTSLEETLFDEFDDEDKKIAAQPQQGPSPATDSGSMEMSIEIEEETKYLNMPEQLKCKFRPLDFISLCLKEKDESTCVVETPDIAEAAKQDRHARYEAALDRMRELQTYNEGCMLGRQRTRYILLEKLFIDSQWNQGLIDVLEARAEAIAKETLMRSLSATKKKQETKQKK